MSEKLKPITDDELENRNEELRRQLKGVSA